MSALVHRISLSVRFASVAVIGALLALLLWAPGASAASDPTQEQYNPVTHVSHGSGASGLEKTVVGGLPFTGLDLIALLGVAVLLTSMGLALRRLTVDRNSRP
ncbi:MAG: hypothetical protein ACXWZM_01270 [Solirubrobacterales bacterium]